MRMMPTEAELRAILRIDLVYFAVGVLILTVGALTLIQSLVDRLRQHMVFLFGLVGLLYGTRLLFQIRIFQFTVGGSRYATSQTWAILNYLIPIAGIYLWSFFVSPRSRRIVYLAVAAHAVFAAIGIPHDLLTRQPWSFPRTNGALVIATSLLVAILIVMDIRSGFIPLDVPIRVAGAGFVIFQLGVIYDNLVSLRVVPSLWTEPFAFTLFLLAMGYAIQYKIATDRNRMVAMQSEMEQARRIQLSVLPAGPPASAYYEIAANYSPMTSVAGDLYDFLPLGEDRLGLFIADVSGHGLPAALVASMLKTALIIYGRTAVGPAALLAELNRAFCGQSHGQFVTAAIAVLDGPAETLTYSAAGHPPLLLWSVASADVQQLEQNGLPLGILPDAEYSEITVPFAKGDRLAMYTDGIVESENGGEEEFGKDRLSEFLKSAGDDPNVRLENAMTAVRRWRGAEREQSDDLTLLIAEYVAERS
jgi:sigma-B regulation protein RsbU (phosphoserine phosphatase)